VNEKKIKVDYMARVEGEAALDITVSNGEIVDLKLNVFEPARFFESFLIGRKFDEVPEIAARICGICPVSHILTSIQAIEDALEIVPSGETMRLRKLLALSQWIQSHTLHTYMLALPDYFGYQSVLDMIPEHRELVEQALRLKRLGNDLTVAIGGREVHPVTPVVGGFTHVPPRDVIKDLIKRFKEARKDAQNMVEIAAQIELPDFTRDFEYVALTSPPQEYPIISGFIASNKGLKFKKNEYRKNIHEVHVSHSNALHSFVKGRSSFMVGPLARVNLNYDLLAGEARRAAERNGLKFPSMNPFYSIPARAVEVVHSIETCIDLLEDLKLKAEQIPAVPKDGTGFGIGEAPRGLLYHSYKINKKGEIVEADIVSPTAHNAFNIENDLKEFVPKFISLPKEEIQLKCEMLVRAYDPCFSCSAHFLKINIRER